MRPSRPGVRVAKIGAGLVASVLGALIGLSLLPAHAIAGSVGGAVTDTAGNPLAGVEVAAYTSVLDDQSEYRCVETTITRADGRYTLANLAPGRYRIASGGRSGSPTIDWLGGVSYGTASDYVVGGGGIAVDIVRVPFAMIAGQVVASGGNPIADATVMLLPAGDPHNELELGVWASTDASGNYVFQEVAAEEEHILLVTAAGYQPRFHTSGGDGEPAVIYADPGSTLSGVDVALSRSGLIHGRAAHSGVPLADVRVDLWRLSSGTYELFGAPSFTDADGNYEALDVPEGIYRVAFTPPWEAGVHPTYSGGAGSLDSAADISVEGLTGLARVDAEFVGDTSPGGLIGQVVDGYGVAITGAAVEVYALWQDGTVLAASATTDVMGGYAVAALPPGDYVLRVTPSALTPQWVVDGGAPTAAVFTVAPSQTTVVPDYAYRAGGAIAGVLSVPGGLSDHEGELTVRIYEVRADAAGETDYLEAAEAICELGGGYAVAGLPSGSYVLAFESADPRCSVRYWPDASSIESATPVTVADGAVLTGYDGTLGIRGSLGGVVSDSAGEPLLGISVTAHGPRGAIATTTVTGGTYMLPALEAGEYLLEFVDPSDQYRSRFYADPSTTETVTPVAVRDGVETMSLDVRMVLGGSVSGRVHDERGNPADECEVRLYRSVEAALEPVKTARPSPNGEFGFAGLDAGDYALEFTVPETSTLLPQYHGGGSVRPGAVLALADGQQMQLETTTLLDGASIFGTVTDSSGAPMGEAKIVARGAHSLTREVFSATDGSYLLQGLASGQYDVVASAPRDAPVARTGGADFIARSIQAVAGEPYGGLDFEFPLAATISGRVITEDAAPVVGADVVLYADYIPEVEGEAADFSAVGATARTDEDGRFGFTGLATGRYRCQVIPAEQSGLSARFFGGLTLGEAETFALVAGQNQSLGESVMSRGTVVSGVLLDSLGQPLPPALVGVVAYLDDGMGWRPTSAATVDDVGNFRFGGLAPGVYKFKMEALGYEDRWFDSGSSLVDASEVSVGLDAVSLGVNVMQLLPQTVYVSEIVPATTSLAIAEGSTSQLVWDVAPIDATDARVEWFSQNQDVARVSSTGLVTGVSPGSARLVGSALDGSGCTVELTATVVPGSLTIDPIAGTSRYATAIEASKKAFPDGAPCVVIATGSNWPDALGGGALAAAKGGPILLTQANVLPGDVLAEIERLGATEAVVLGGEAAVGKPVFDALKAELGSGNVTRIGGAGRYQTAEMIADATVAELGAAYDGTVFIATGSNFPDALGASPLAAAKGWPLLLSGPDGLGASTLSTLNGIGATKALVLGGTAVVPDSVMGQLSGRSPERLQGAGRYGTARVVAEYGVAHAGLGWDKVAIATGENFPDALAGGVLQGLDGSVMLLTPGAYLHAEPQGALSANKADIHTVRFLGGDSAVKPATRTQVQAVLE